MIKAIKLTEKNWELLLTEIKKTYQAKPSTYLVRSRMRSVLGFTPRHQAAWTTIPNTKGEYYKEPQVLLDFFDEKKYTMFLLKYGTFIDDTPTRR
jgi:hypothetical protein